MTTAKKTLSWTGLRKFYEPLCLMRKHSYNDVTTNCMKIKLSLLRHRLQREIGIGFFMKPSISGYDDIWLCEQWVETVPTAILIQLQEVAMIPSCLQHTINDKETGFWGRIIWFSYMHLHLDCNMQHQLANWQQYVNFLWNNDMWFGYNTSQKCHSGRMKLCNSV
jgi:hypothetical protein